MSYQRVIPRDLFNEGDLLNCLGRLWIKLDELPPDRRGDRVKIIASDFLTTRFFIEQDESDGSLSVVNVKLKLGEYVDIRLFRPLNARSKWPLWARFGDEDVRVFDEETGELSPEFLHSIAAEETTA